MAETIRGGFVLCLTYHLPNVSGLTMSAHQVARAVQARGHDVAVVTGRSPADLPAREIMDGMEVTRVRAWGRLGKALIMPGYAAALWRAMRGRSFVNVHLPNMDAAIIAVTARLRGRRLIVSYISSMSKAGFGARLMRAVAAMSHLVAGALAERIVVTSADYAEQSTFCRIFRRKVVPAPLPIWLNLLPGETPRAPGIRTSSADAPFRIGYVGRIARQKSLDVLLAAIPRLAERLGPHFTIDLIGPTDAVIGENDWRAILAEAERSGGRIRHLGTLHGADLAAAYRDLDVMVLPSTDRLESFGLVQVEAMWRGVPCVASDLPGMRYPVQVSGMGRLAPPRDARALADALADTLLMGPPHHASADELERLFGVETACKPYLDLVGTAERTS